MLAPDWAQKMLCIIVTNPRKASPEFFSFCTQSGASIRLTVWSQYPGALPPVLERQAACLALHAACLRWPKKKTRKYIAGYAG